MPKDKKKKQDNQRVPSTRQSPSHNTKRYEFQTLIPTPSAEASAQATKGRQAMAPPTEDNPEGSKPTGSKTEEAKQVSDEESQKETPPLVPSKVKDAIPPDKESDDNVASIHSDITCSTKSSSPYKPEQAGYYRRRFDSLLYKLLQRLLAFKSKDPIPVVSLALQESGTRSVIDFIGLSDEDVDSLGFQDGRAHRLLGPSHKKSIRIPVSYTHLRAHET